MTCCRPSTQRGEQWIPAAVVCNNTAAACFRRAVWLAVHARRDADRMLSPPERTQVTPALHPAAASAAVNQLAGIHHYTHITSKHCAPQGHNPVTSSSTAAWILTPSLHSPCTISPPPHHTTPHHTTPHHTTPHHTTPHHTTPHHTTPHHTQAQTKAPRRPGTGSVHCSTPHHTTPH